MFNGNYEFIRGAVKSSDFPPEELPEFAFIGRSNVGKSSIINSVLHNRKVARISNTPGRTQQINFFNIDDKLILADLPGYGYAKAPEKEIKKWNKLAKEYLTGRRKLKRAFLLVDVRVGLKDNDRKTLDTLDEAAVSSQIVITKADKLNRSEIENTVSCLKQEICNYTALCQDLLVTSAAEGRGIDELRDVIKGLL